MPGKIFRVELHQHTCYSPDSSITYQQLSEAYREGKFDVIAITDHDTIEGAVKFREKGDFPIIIGEEITTPGNKDLIGLFLTERIPPFLSLKETIAAIKSQGGLVMAAHPFNRVNLGIGKKGLLDYLDDIDIVEVYNAAGGDLMERNSRALEFARNYGKLMSAGSDAHFVNEIGSAVSLIEAKDLEELLTPMGLLRGLKGCEFDVNYYSVFNCMVRRLFYIFKMMLYRRTLPSV
ncbi:PHP domain-containing protein [Patescibacteria group bacterium]|nr:PHP domain-containing protein [Patescibacteria group bacterium]